MSQVIGENDFITKLLIELGLEWITKKATYVADLTEFMSSAVVVAGTSTDAITDSTATGRSFIKVPDLLGVSHPIVYADNTVHLVGPDTFRISIGAAGPIELALKADLVNGKVPQSQLPDVDPIEFPEAPVMSVNGKTGAVSIFFTDLFGKPTTLGGYGITDAQPLNANLTDLATQSTTSFGRGILNTADQSAARTYIGAGTGIVSTLGLSLTGGLLGSITNNGTATPTINVGLGPTANVTVASVGGSAAGLGSFNFTSGAGSIEMLTLEVQPQVLYLAANAPGVMGLYINLGVNSTGDIMKIDSQGNNKMLLDENGSMTIAGTLTCTNFSGTNTGDQDTSGFVLQTRTINGYPLNADVVIDASQIPGFAGVSLVVNSLTAIGTAIPYAQTMSIDRFSIDAGPIIPRIVAWGPDNSTIGWMVLSASSLDGSVYKDFFSYNDAGDGSGPRFHDPQGLAIWTIGDGDQIVIKPNNTGVDLAHMYRLYISNFKLGGDRVWNFPDADGTFVGLDTTQTITNKIYVGQKFHLGASGTPNDGHSLIMDRYDPGDGSFVHRISAHGTNTGTKGRLAIEIASSDASIFQTVLLALESGSVSLPFLSTNGFIRTNSGQGILSVTPSSVFATGASHTVDELITALQTFGIFTQT